MAGNLTEFAVTVGASINWLTAIIGLAGGILGIYVWFYERENLKKSTLFYPLYLACRGILDILEKQNYENLSEERSRNLFASCAKTLDEIAYNHGSIIYLKNDDLRKFLDLKKAVDEKLEAFPKHNWIGLKDKFKSGEFKDIENNARTLLSRCREMEKSLRKL
jgi:hypothetical protein